MFAADRTGEGRFGSTDEGISGTRDDALYQSYAFDKGGLDYAFAVEDGTYRVALHFAENHAPNFRKGGLTFDVTVEGEVAARGLDVFAEAGGHGAHVLERTVEVTDGELNVGAVKMAAIAFERVGDVGSGPSGPKPAPRPEPQAEDGDTVMAINVGSRTAYKAADGTVFAADKTGVGSKFSTNAQIAGTQDDALYRTSVWSDDGLSYDLAVEDGAYAVTLHFAEIWSGAFSKGAREFDVALEDRLIVDDLDVFAAAGARKAVEVRYAVTVDDGVLDIDLIKGKQNPMLNAIEVERLDGGAGSGGGSGSGGGAGAGSGSGGSGAASPRAVADAFAFDWARDVRVDRDTGMASVSLSASDLLANDRGGRDLQIVVEEEPNEGVLQLAGEATDITFLFDPARFDGRTSFTYRALGDGDAVSAPASVTIDVGGMPAASKPAATLALVDASTDRALFTLGASTILDADGVEGRKLTVAAIPEVSGVSSARMLLDGRSTQVENVEPYALFGDVSGDFEPGLDLDRGDVVTVGAKLFGGNGARGAFRGEAEARLSVDTGTIEGTYHAPDVFAFDETDMGADRIRSFEGFDQLAFFGGTVDRARDVLRLAREVDGDTVIDFGGGDVLTLEDFTGLTADHILL